MKRSIILSTIAAMALSSCGQSSKSTPGTVAIETLHSTKNVQSQKNLSSEKYIHTKYEYTDSTGRRLIIENSLPKSGIHYTDPTGKRHIYAVFFARIVNETNNPCELRLYFPAEWARLPSAPGVYYRLFFPPDTMTIDKEPLYDYGLAHLKSFLDTGLSKPSSLKRIIYPKASNAFYVVTLSNKGVDGPIRTGFTFKDESIFYSINKTEIQVGEINLKGLTLRK